MSIAMIALTLLLIGPERCTAYIDPGGNLDKKTRIFFGAKSAGQAACKYREKLSQQGTDAIFATDKWGYAGILSFYTPGHPYYFAIPAPSRHGQDYALWNKKHPLSSNAVFVIRRSELRQSVKNLCTNTKRLNEETDAYGFYLCTGFKPTEK